MKHFVVASAIPFSCPALSSRAAESMYSDPGIGRSHS